MTKPIKDWKNILLDTSVIIDRIMEPDRLLKNELARQRVSNTHKLFQYFEDSVEGNRRTLYISSITLSELRKLPTNTTILEILINLFNASDVVFVDFRKEMAMQIHHHTQLMEKDPNLNKLLKDLSTKLNQTNVY